MAKTARRPAQIVLPLVLLLQTFADRVTGSDLPRIGLQHQFGETPGFEESFTRVQVFAPLYGESNDWILFGDLLGTVDSSGSPSSSTGLALRFVPRSSRNVFAIYTHYDFRELEFARQDYDFHRWGLGAELLGEVWAARTNVYLSASGRRAADAFFEPDVRYLDRFLLLGRARSSFVEQLHGVDFEVSRLLTRPFGLPVDQEIGVGGYYWDTPRGDGNHTTGVKGRIHTWLTDSLATYVQATHDRVFETSVGAGFVWYLGGPGTRPSERMASLSARIATPIQRQYEIPVLRYREDNVFFATNPATGQRITLTHVDDSAPAAGTGTWERPFSRLQAASLSGTDIVLVQDGTYTNDFIALSPGQRLLAVNLPHFADTRELGPILLPGTATGGASTILNSPFDAITVASATEVAGFEIVGAANNGIYGSGVGDVLIRSNTISQSGRDGITLLELFGTGQLDSNQLLQNSANGLLITAGEVELGLVSNVARQNTLAGMKVEANVFTGDVSGNVVSENNRYGIDMLVGGSMRGSIVENVATANRFSGIQIVTPRLSGSILNNAINRNGGWGIRVNSKLTGDISGNIVNDNGGDGILMEGQVVGSIRNNIAINNGSSVPGPGILAVGGVTGDIAHNVASGNAGAGIWLQGSVGGSVANNVTDDNGASGIHILAGGGVGGHLSGNTANRNGRVGIHITGGSGARINGSVSHNTADGNGSRAGHLSGAGIHVHVAEGIGGDIIGNQATENRDSGILIITDGVGARIDGSISQNTADGNGGHAGSLNGAGIDVRTAEGIGGDIIGNQASGNGDAGIRIDIVRSFIDYEGDVVGNLSNENRDGFVFSVRGDFIGNFTRNTANPNNQEGFQTSASGTVSGTTTGNAASGNGFANFSGNIAQP